MLAQRLKLPKITVKDLLKIIWFGLLCSLAPSVGAISNVKSIMGQVDLTLSGIGVFKKYNKPLYIAAFYQQMNAYSDETIMHPANAKRMEMRIIENNLSSKKFSRYFAYQIRRNNAPEFVSKQEQNVATFLKSLTGRLMQGDHLIIEYVPGEGSVLVLNGKILNRIEEPSFFGVLLNAWIGPKPPSAKFKEGILGKNSDSEALALQNQYEGLKQM